MSEDLFAGKEWRPKHLSEAMEERAIEFANEVVRAGGPDLARQFVERMVLEQAELLEKHAEPDNPALLMLRRIREEQPWKGENTEGR